MDTGQRCLLELYEWGLGIRVGYVQYVIIIDELLIGFTYPTGAVTSSDNFETSSIRKGPAWGEVSFEIV